LPTPTPTFTLHMSKQNQNALILSSSLFKWLFLTPYPWHT
jgi:hypothetical protein